MSRFDSFEGYDTGGINTTVAIVATVAVVVGVVLTVLGDIILEYWEINFRFLAVASGHHVTMHCVCIRRMGFSAIVHLSYT